MNIVLFLLKKNSIAYMAQASVSNPCISLNLREDYTLSYGDVPQMRSCTTNTITYAIS